MKTNSIYTSSWIITFVLLMSCSKERVRQQEGLDNIAPLESSQSVMHGQASACSFDDGIVASFNANFGQLPEGIALDNTGNLYASMAPLGIIVRIDCNGGTAPIADIGPTPLGPGELLLGLATDATGIVYAAMNAPGKPYNGVWAIDPQSGETHQLPGSQQIFFPNGLTFDPRGNLYVTSTSGAPTGPGTFGPGSIWRIPPRGEAALWLSDVSLTGLVTQLTALPVPLGANGIAYHKQVLYVANTSKYQIVKVAIQPDGSPGKPEVFINLFNPANPFAGVPDGIAVDVRGNLYVATPADHKILRISSDGSQITTVADPGDQLTNPASLVFGRTANNQKALFVTNFTAPDLPKPVTPAGPAVIKIDVGIPGNPIR